eukprot:g365.t1
MRCFYEVLELPQDADDDAIKRAYRLQALKWHPDKNPTPEAEDRFKEISNAFEVLSDVHERAWYDSHRESILNSDTLHQTGGVSSGPGSGNLPDLYPYFTSSCFSGHHSGPKGFYSVYGGVFNQIGVREVESGGKLGIEFGTEESSSSEITQFYTYWSAFTTSIEFAFVDEFNLASAPNRKVRRAMEDQNLKKRKSAKREYIETVRQLVSFVKKRDLRILRIKKQEAEKRAQIKAKEELRRKEEQQERQRKATEYRDAEWIVRSEIVDEEDDRSEESVRNELWCVICDKVFKSERALENHQKSKKHRENVANLQKEIELELDSSPLKEKQKKKSKLKSEEAIIQRPGFGELNEGGVSDSESEIDDDEFVARFSGLRYTETNEEEEKESLELDDDNCNDDNRKVESEKFQSNEVLNEDQKISKSRKKKSRRSTKGKKPEDKKEEIQTQEMLFQCGTCSEQFSSRNQLFKHLKQTKHARTKL